MTMTRDRVPVEEHDTLIMYNLLSKKEKRVLSDLVQNASNDSVTMCMKINKEIRRLEQMGLIEINPNYLGASYCFYVLKDAPFLKKKLLSQPKWRLLY